MMAGFDAVFWREMILMRRRWQKLLLGMAVSPALYLFTFGYALGGQVRLAGVGYLEFLLPGLVAMCSMTQAFAMASEINVARFYNGIFEEIHASPASRAAYVGGEMAAGMVRVLVGCAVILLLGRAAGVILSWGWAFWLAILLNSCVFAALAVALALMVKSHADQAMLNNFIITPLAFLGGTFFPIDAFPPWGQAIFNILPLSHASRLIRADALGLPINYGSFIYLAVAAIFCTGLALRTVGRVKN